MGWLNYSLLLKKGLIRGEFKREGGGLNREITEREHIKNIIITRASVVARIKVSCPDCVVDT